LKKHDIPRESVVILTKTFNPDDSDGGPAGLVNQKGLSRKVSTPSTTPWSAGGRQVPLTPQRIFASVKRSLERLQLDYVDVLQCHRFDYDTPIEETMQALHDLVQQGLVHYIGMSSCWAWQMQLMQRECMSRVTRNRQLTCPEYAIHNRLTPFISMQNQHSGMYREVCDPTPGHIGCISRADSDRKSAR
jgi:aryl-alcohol dehydrogenase-like predicted oxidoreductase